MGSAPTEVQGPTQQEQALTDVSSEMWNDYVSRFRPAEVALYERSKLTAGERAQVKGEASADAAAAFEGLNRNTLSANAGQISSGRNKLSLAGNAEAQGKARGLGAAGAELGAELDSEQQRLKIAGFGRGTATNTVADLSRIARRSTIKSISEAERRFERNNNLTMAGAAVAGAGLRKFQLRDKGGYDPLNQSELLQAERLGINIPEFDFGNPNLGVDAMGRFPFDFGGGGRG